MVIATGTQPWAIARDDPGAGGMTMLVAWPCHAGRWWKPMPLKRVFKGCARVCAFLGVRWSLRGLAERPQLRPVPPQIVLATSGAK